MTDRPKRIRGTSQEVELAARRLRHEMTPAEEKLWKALKGHHLLGLKFRRQHPLGRFILDFCCPEHKLVVELDGGIHQSTEEYDEARTEHLEAHGYRVLRVPNEDILMDLDSVLDHIRTLTADG